MRTIVPKDARLIPPEATRVFKGVIYDIYHWPQKMFDGSTATFEMLKRKDTVKVLAVKNDKLVFLEEQQPSYGKPTWVMPGGRHDVEEETELQCAQRELHEETGMVFNSWKLITARQPLDEMDYVVYIFLATDFARQDEAHIDGGERITVHELPFDDAAKIEPGHPSLNLAIDLLREVGSLEGLLALPEYR